MGKLLDAIYAVPPDEASGAGCKVRTYLDTLPPEDSDDLKDALAAKIGEQFAASAARISLAMSQNGAPISSSLINAHRARTCRCYRKVSGNV